MTTKSRAALALLFLVPAPSIGVIMLLYVAPGDHDGRLGKAVWALSKVWLALFPLVWWKLVERGQWSLSRPRQGGLRMGALLGVVIAVAIMLAYRVIGESLIDPQQIEDMVGKIDLDQPAIYISVAAYLTIVNSLIEEYVWRWFVYIQCERLVGRWPAVGLTALLFTLHHVLVLNAQFGWAVTALGSAGVFAGSLAWSWCYVRYRSVWPGYLSHIAADLAVLWIGWVLIFG